MKNNDKKLVLWIVSVSQSSKGGLPQNAKIYSITQLTKVGRLNSNIGDPEDTLLSRHQGDFWVAEGKLFWRETSKSNSSKLNNSKLQPGQSVELKVGDVLRFGLMTAIIQQQTPLQATPTQNLIPRSPKNRSKIHFLGVLVVSILTLTGASTFFHVQNKQSKYAPLHQRVQKFEPLLNSEKAPDPSLMKLIATNHVAWREAEASFAELFRKLTNPLTALSRLPPEKMSQIFDKTFRYPPNFGELLSEVYSDLRTNIQNIKQIVDQTTSILNILPLFAQPETYQCVTNTFNEDPARNQCHALLEAQVLNANVDDLLRAHILYADLSGNTKQFQNLMRLLSNIEKTRSSNIIQFIDTYWASLLGNDLYLLGIIAKSSPHETHRTLAKNFIASLDLETVNPMKQVIEVEGLIRPYQYLNQQRSPFNLVLSSGWTSEGSIGHILKALITALDYTGFLTFYLDLEETERLFYTHYLSLVQDLEEYENNPHDAFETRRFKKSISDMIETLQRSHFLSSDQLRLSLMSIDIVNYAKFIEGFWERKRRTQILREALLEIL